MSDILSQIEEIQGNVRDIKATWGNTIMMLDNIKSSLKADRQKAIDEAYQKGFEAGQHEATTLEYQQGLDEAWECAKRIALIKTDKDCHYFTVTELEKIFGYCNYHNVLDTYSASEAIEKVKAYEEQQKADKIAVGDEVMSNNAISDHTGVVLTLSPGGKSAKVLENDGSMAWVAVNVLIKTGRHFNFLASLLNSMKEGAE